jgi:hypothetical protein
MFPCGSLFQNEKKVTTTALATDELAHQRIDAIFCVTAVANKHVNSRNNAIDMTNVARPS